jgi:nitrogen fixation protein NifB
MNMSKSDRHPCFSRKASGSCGRVHLPVAPGCNISCNYCNRKYDCVNESRPGVTSGLLRPEQAAGYVDDVLAREPRVTVAGIAGPGDPMANPEETLATMRLVRRRHPDMVFCLSSNGLDLPAHLEELAAAGLSHLTVTINAAEPEVGERIYAWARDGKVLYRGRMAAEFLLSRQMEALNGARRLGLSVKVNSIVIPGVNEEHVLEVARLAGEMDTELMNLIPLHPTAGTPFADLPVPDRTLMRGLRREAGRFVRQMTHCRRCRADAVGMLCKDLSGELAENIRERAFGTPDSGADRPCVAVATREGMLVNMHLGEAASFHIYEPEGDGFRLVDERRAPAAGCGPARWDRLASALSDCRAVLARAIGESPRGILAQRGVAPVEASGLISEALEIVFSGGETSRLKGRREAEGCGCKTGSGEGCG